MTLDILSNLTGAQFLAPGGHNWPDMQVVIDPDQIEVVDDQIYLISIQGHSAPEIKRLQNGNGCYRVHPAVSGFEPATEKKSRNILGVDVPIIGSIEFSNSYYHRYVTIHGRFVGLWAGDGAVKEDV